MQITDVKIEYIIEYALIWFLSFFGSFAKDYLTILKNGTGKVSIVKILLSTIAASLIVFAFSVYIQEHFGGIRGLMLASFTAGLAGFELLENMSTLKGILKLIKDFIDFTSKKK